jgi:hypothetical protein
MAVNWQQIDARLNAMTIASRSDTPIGISTQDGTPATGRRGSLPSVPETDQRGSVPGVNDRINHGSALASVVSFLFSQLVNHSVNRQIERGFRELERDYHGVLQGIPSNKGVVAVVALIVTQTDVSVSNVDYVDLVGPPCYFDTPAMGINVFRRTSRIETGTTVFQRKEYQYYWGTLRH